MAHLTFSPFKPNVDHLSSPFTFMNQLSPLIKFGNGQLMSPGLTPLLGQSMDSLNPMPVSNLMDAANFGIASPPSAGASPSQQFGFGRLNSVRKIEFGDPDASADMLASRFQEPRSLTQLHAGEDEERSRDGMDFGMPHTEVTVSDMDDDMDARLDDSRIALATRVGLPPAKRAHVEFELQSSDDGERAHHAPAKAAPRRKAPQAQKTKLRSRAESTGDSQLVSPVPQAAVTVRAYSTPSNRPLPSNDATPVPAAKRSTPCNCKKSKCLKLYACLPVDAACCSVHARAV
jgi:hypothetical protein